MSPSWRPTDPVPERGRPARRDDPSPIGPAIDRVLAGLGAPPADALTTIFERWSALAGLPLADHGAPAALDHGVLVVHVTEPAWSTEWRYRQGEVLRRCDATLGEGVITRIEVRVARR